MDKLRIVGGKRLSGEIPIGGAKNAALPLMAASLLTDQELTLRHVPRLADIDTMTNLLVQHGVTVTLVWMATTATSGNVVWSVAIERDDTATDLDTDSFATANTATAAAPATSGAPAYTTIAFTNGAQMDSLAVGEAFRLKVQRTGSSGSDTATGDAELLAVEIKET